MDIGDIYGLPEEDVAIESDLDSGDGKGEDSDLKVVEIPSRRR